MKFWFTIAIVASFLGIAVFGVFAMSHGGHAFGGCVAATASGVPCPTENNALASALFHLSAFKNFSTAALIDLAARFLLFVFSLLCGLYAHICFRRNVLSKQAYFASSSGGQIPAVGDSLHWLALHENSPNTIL